MIVAPAGCAPLCPGHRVGRLRAVAVEEGELGAIVAIHDGEIARGQNSPIREQGKVRHGVIGAGLDFESRVEGTARVQAADPAESFSI